jgi:threonine/homoserine/homoserine lactone efflux protein
MELLLPLLSFAFVSSITPGPNNLMLSASGVVFGFNRTLPHLLGVAVGFTLLLVVCASGVGALLLGLPAAALILRSAAPCICSISRGRTATRLRRRPEAPPRGR